MYIVCYNGAMTRKEIMKKLRDNRYTYSQIGDLFGLTRQRVHQIIKSPTYAKNPDYIANEGVVYKYGKPIELEGKDYLKEIVRIRDNYTCQLCGKIWKEGTRRLDVHHLNHLESQTEAMEYKNNKDLDQLITLCHKCHMNVPHHKKAMSEAIRKPTKQGCV